MNPFQSDNIWKKKARQGKAQQHPLTPRQEWQKQVNSSSLWLGGGVVLLALYLAAVRAGTVAWSAPRRVPSMSRQMSLMSVISSASPHGAPFPRCPPG